MQSGDNHPPTHLLRHFRSIAAAVRSSLQGAFLERILKGKKKEGVKSVHQRQQNGKGSGILVVRGVAGVP